MTRILSTTALILVWSAPAALAGPEQATENNLITIQRFVPEAEMADLRAMSDERVLSILNEINSGGTHSDKTTTVQALFVDNMNSDGAMTVAPVNDDTANLSNLRLVQDYVPEATLSDLKMMEDSDILAMVNEIGSGNDIGEIRATIRALYRDALS